MSHSTRFSIGRWTSAVLKFGFLGFFVFFTSVSVFPEGARSFWQLSFAEQAELLPELKPMFDQLMKRDWQQARKTAELFSAGHSVVSSTSKLVARFYAVEAERRAARVKARELYGSLSGDRPLFPSLKSKLEGLSKRVNSFYLANPTWLIRELRDLVDYEIGWYELELGNRREAMQWFIQVVDRNPESHLVSDLVVHRMAEVYTSQGDLAGCLSHLQSLRAKYSHVPRLVFHTYFASAIAQWHLSEDKEKALQFCNSAIRSVTKEELQAIAKRYISQVIGPD